MAFSGNDSTEYHHCISVQNGTISLIITLISLPFHMLMVKILAKDIQLPSPRHRIMFSLSLSDLLQISVLFFCNTITTIFSTSTVSSLCRVVRYIGVFSAILTGAVSSLTILTLSVERLAICLYFLRYHRIFSRKNTNIALCCHWFLGVFLATIATVAYQIRSDDEPFTTANAFQIIVISLVLPCAGALIVMQVRLFVFARARLRRLMPGRSTNSNLPENRRTREIKIAFVSSTIFFAYIVCMLPMAVTFFLEQIQISSIPSHIKRYIVNLAVLNNLLDPFIYGAGLAQTRQLLIMNMRRFSPFCCRP